MTNCFLTFSVCGAREIIAGPNCEATDALLLCQLAVGPGDGILGCAGSFRMMAA